MIFLAANDFYLGVFLFCCLVTFVAFIAAIVLLIRKKRKMAKIAFIVCGVSFLIGIGSCGMFWETFSLDPR